MLTDMRFLSIIILIFAVLIFARAHAAEPVYCTMEYAPVCAAKQVQCIRAPCNPVYQTYSNTCMANADDARIIHQGECTGSESGPVAEPAPYTPPKGCTAWYDGCNWCSKDASGASMCTLRACQAGKTEPGYCSSYEAPKPAPSGGGSVGNGSTGSGSVEPAPPLPSPVTESAPAPEKENVFARVWNWVRHLLGF